MGRIGDAIWSGLVSGAIRGLEDCIVAPLNVESKTNNIANQHLPAAVRSPSEEKRAPVGSRPSSSSTWRSRLSFAFPNSTRPSPTSNQPTESKVDSAVKPYLPEVTRSSSEGEGRVLPPFPSFEQLADGFQRALTDARKERNLDGNNGGEKIHLKDIAKSGRNQVLLNAGVVHPDDVNIYYGVTANLAKNKIETFIKEVAPGVNAREVAEVAFLKSGAAVKFGTCVKHAAQAALENIQQQRQGVHASINQEGDVGYNLNPRQAFTQSAQGPCDYEPSQESANPYSPMGGSGESQSISIQSDNGQDSVKTDQEKSWTKDVSGFLRDTNAKVSGGVTLGFSGIGVDGRLEMDADIVFNKVVDVIQDLPPLIPSNIPNIDYTGPVYPEFQGETRISHPPEFVSSPGVDCDGPSFPHS